MTDWVFSSRIQRWLRFVLGGFVNTAFTYAVYLTINTMIGYQSAYFTAYATGVVFAYWFNAVVVFRVPLSWKGLFSYPAVYIVQYSVSALLLGVLIEVVDTHESLAPLVVTIIMIPLTYMMSKRVLERKIHKKDG